MCAEVLENSSVNGGFSWWIFLVDFPAGHI
jgi:hypothetical protein